MTENHGFKISFPQAVFCTLSFLPLLAIYFPRALAFAPIVIGLIGCVTLFVRARHSLIIPRKYYYAVISICGLWLASCLWSVDSAGSFDAFLKGFPILFFGGFLMMLSFSMPVKDLPRVGWIFPLCLSIAASIIAIDLYFQLPLYCLTRGIEMSETLSSAVMNRGIVCGVFCLFPALYFLSVWDGKTLCKKGLSIFLFVSFAAMLMLTQSQSAQLSVLVGLLFFVLFPVRLRSVYWVLSGCVLVLVLISPFLAQWMWEHLAMNISANQWLKNGYAANRMEIWGFVSDRALQSPWIGHGMEATKLIGAFDHVPVYQREVTILHPHNFAIQLWIEFGFLGAMPGGVLLSYIIMSVYGLPAGICRRVCMGNLMAVLAVAGVGYGMWQSWWLGLLIILLALCSMIIRLEREKTGQEGVASV